VEAGVVGEELDPWVDGLPGDAQHLLGVRKPLSRHSGSGERPMPAVQGRHKRFRVTDPPGHVDRLLANRVTTFDRLCTRPHLDRKMGKQVGAQRAVFGR
jgi:hypothetical protein